MPLLTDDMDNFNVGGGFQFSGTKPDNLEATSYTLATILIDTTGSVSGFGNLLLEMLKTATNACRKSAYSENIMTRACLFSTSYNTTNNILELHGFKPINTIDSNDYQPFRIAGGTPLYDAVYSGLASTMEYAKILHDSGYATNAILFIVTDGANTYSKATPKMISDEMARIRNSEQLDSLLPILIGINMQNQEIKAELEKFAKDLGIDRFIDAGVATAQNLAKLADFVSQSVSSTAAAQGTGGPSQNIGTVI